MPTNSMSVTMAPWPHRPSVVRNQAVALPVQPRERRQRFNWWAGAAIVAGAISGSAVVLAIYLLAMWMAS